jgi:hypothetical protein
MREKGETKKISGKKFWPRVAPRHAVQKNSPRVNFRRWRGKISGKTVWQHCFFICFIYVVKGSFTLWRKSRKVRVF